MENTYNSYKSHVRNRATYVDHTGKSQLSNLKSSLRETRTYSLTHHHRNEVDHEQQDTDIPEGISDLNFRKTDETLEHVKELRNTWNPDYDEQITNLWKSFNGWDDKTENPQWERDFAKHEKEGAFNNVDDTLRILYQVSMINDMTMGKEIQKWSHTGSLGQLDQLDSDIKAYATTLPDAWFKLYRKYDEMIAGLETHAEAIQLEVENIEDKLDDLVMGPGMLEEMTNKIERPFFNFWEAVKELTEDFGVRERDHVATAFETVGDDRLAIEDALRTLAASTATRQEVTAGLIENGMARYLLNSKIVETDLKKAASAPGRAVDGALGEVEGQQASLELFEESLGKTLDAVEAAFKHAQSKGRENGLRTVATSMAILGPEIDAMAEQVASGLVKQFRAVASEMLKNVAEKDNEFQSRIMESNLAVRRKDKELAEIAVKVKEEEKIMKDREDKLANVAFNKPAMAKVEKDLANFARQTQSFAIGNQQAALEKLKINSRMQMEATRKQVAISQETLNDANTALLDAVEQRSADLLREASHFARDGISQTNVMKQQMIMVESAMDEAESTLAEILSAEKALINRANVSGAVVVDGAKNANTEVTGMVKFINDTADAKFGKAKEEVMEKVGHLIGTTTSRINTRVSSVKNRYNGLDDNSVYFDERLERAANERALWEAEAQQKSTKIAVGVSGVANHVQGWAEEIRSRVEKVESALDAEASSLENKRSNVKRDGTAKTKALVQFVRSALLDVLTETGEGVEHATNSVQGQERYATQRMKGKLSSLISGLGDAQASSDTALRGVRTAAGLMDDIVNDTSVSTTVNNAVLTVSKVAKQLGIVQADTLDNLKASDKAVGEMNKLVIDADKQNYNEMQDLVGQARNETHLFADAKNSRNGEIQESLAATTEGDQEKIGAMQHAEITALTGLSTASREFAMELQADEGAESQAELRIKQRTNAADMKIKDAEKRAFDDMSTKEIQVHGMASKVQFRAEEAAANAQQVAAVGNRVLAMISPAGITQGEAKKLQMLQRSEGNSIAGVREDALTAETTTENVLFNTKKTIEHETKRIQKLQKAIGDAGANVSKVIEPLRVAVNDDETWTMTVVKDIVGLANGLRKHVGDRSLRLQQVHSEIASDIKRLVAMSANAATGSLDRVLDELKTAIESDSGITHEVEAVLKPQVKHWRTGVQEVFEHLGLATAFDAIEESNERRANASSQRSDEVEEAGEELDGLIHARQLGYELKLGKAEKKESDLVRQALRNMKLTAQQRNQLVSRVKDEIKRERNLFLTRVRGTISTISKVKLQTQKKTEQIDRVIKLANASMASYGAAAPSRDDVRQNAYKLAQDVDVLRLHPKLRGIGTTMSLLQVGAEAKAGEALQLVASKIDGLSHDVTIEDDQLDSELRMLAETQSQDLRRAPQTALAP